MKDLNFKRNVNVITSGNPDSTGILQTVGLPKTQIVVPNLVGQTLADAIAHLTSASLVKGTVTLTNGPVASQSVAAGTLANVGTNINITLTS